MIHYSCDLCNRPCDDKTYAIPIAATFIEQEPYECMPVEMNLCAECKRSIYKAVEQIVPKDKLKSLNGLALDKKFAYNTQK